MGLGDLMKIFFALAHNNAISIKNACDLKIYWNFKNRENQSLQLFESGNTSVYLLSTADIGIKWDRKQLIFF